MTEKSDKPAPKPKPEPKSTSFNAENTPRHKLLAMGQNIDAAGGGSPKTKP